MLTNHPLVIEWMGFGYVGIPSEGFLHACNQGRRAQIVIAQIGSAFRLGADKVFADLGNPFIIALSGVATAGDQNVIFVVDDPVVKAEADIVRQLRLIPYPIPAVRLVTREVV
ncbi:hypothetical protein D3C80_1737230 [compost metagenome]